MINLGDVIGEIVSMLINNGDTDLARDTKEFIEHYNISKQIEELSNKTEDGK